MAQSLSCTQASTAASPAVIQEILSPVSLSLERGILQQPIPTWCSNRNNNYCTYGWNALSRCCYPTYTQPGAYCDAVCE
jgi:hypothetical protein